ncbi:MAG: histidine phosphatase family protein [Rhodoblastus sp.]
MDFDLKTPLFFFRHGETFYNAEGRIQGRLDTPLSPLGRRQAGEVGGKLAAALADHGLAPDAAEWFSSPLSRASESMELAREAMGMPVDGFSHDDRLTELSFGAWQNLTWPEIGAAYPAGVAAREKDFWNFRPPDGESYADLSMRVAAFLGELPGPAIVAAHGGVARALMVLIGGLRPAKARLAPAHQGRLLVFAGGRGRWR